MQITQYKTYNSIPKYRMSDLDIGHEISSPLSELKEVLFLYDFSLQITKFIG